MAHLMSRFNTRIALALLGCVLVAPVQGQMSSDPEKLLSEADRLAWLRAWTRAEPLYARAREAFIARGDRRNALYAEVGRLRGQLPTLALSDASNRLAEYLENPMVENDARLRLRVLVIKGETDADLDPALSQRSWTEALAIAENVGEAAWANRARAELGLAAFLLGDPNKAIVNLGQAIKVAEGNGDTSSLVRWLTLFGQGYAELGRPEQAIDFYDRALKVAGTVPELQLPLMTYVGKADALMKLARPAEGEQLLTAALESARKQRALGYQAELTLRLALVALQRQQVDQALEAMTRASSFARAAGGGRILAGIAVERAQVLRSLNRVADADATLREGISAARGMGERLLLPRMLAQLADLQLSRGHRVEAATLLEEADDIVEGLLTRASSPWTRSRIIGGMDKVVVARIRLEGERGAGDPTRLFAVLERARGRSMLGLLGSHPAASDQQLKEWRASERAISSLQLQLIRTTDRNARQHLLDQIVVAEDRMAPLSTRVFAAAASPARAPVSLARVQRALNPNELLLEYVLAEPTSFVIAATRTSARLVSLPGRSATETHIQALVGAIQNGQSATAEARALGNALLGGVPDIARYAHIVVSADGMGHKVPFELLIPPAGVALLDSHVVSYVPSASTLVAIRNRPVVSPTQMALAIGASPDPGSGAAPRPALIGNVTRGVYDIDTEQLRALPSAGDEARAVAAAFAGQSSTVLVGDAATEQALKAQPLANFRLLHFAAHGIVSTKSPERSAIVLRPAGDDDGLFQAREILDLHLNADLVTLSACDTGTGAVHGQEGVASLVRPFLAAGARAVVANLWAADDAFSLSLMEEFYRQLATGTDVGESLRQAKLTMRRQFGPAALPRLWSGVLVSGDGAVSVMPAAPGPR